MVWAFTTPFQRMGAATRILLLFYPSPCVKFFLFNGPTQDWNTPFCTGCNSSTFGVWYTVNYFLDRLKHELVEKSKNFDESSSSTFWASVLWKSHFSHLSWWYQLKSSLIQKKRFYSTKLRSEFKILSVSWVRLKDKSSGKNSKIFGFSMFQTQYLS